MFLFTSALVEDEWSPSHPGRFIPDGTAPSTHCIGHWVGPESGLDDVRKGKFLTLPGLELRQLSSPDRSHRIEQKLFRGQSECLLFG
jgi:hypothetical protein